MNTTDKIMALADALSDADFELARINSYGGDTTKAVSAAKAAQDKLRAEIEALVRDAERLKAANAALQADVAHKDAYAEQLGRELSKADSECKALREKAAMHDAMQEKQS